MHLATMKILRLLVLFNFDIPLYRSNLAASSADSRYESSNCSSRSLQVVFALFSRWPAFFKSLDFSVKSYVSCQICPFRQCPAGSRYCCGRAYACSWKRKNDFQCLLSSPVVQTECLFSLSSGCGSTSKSTHHRQVAGLLCQKRFCSTLCLDFRI